MMSWCYSWNFIPVESPSTLIKFFWKADGTII